MNELEETQILKLKEILKSSYEKFDTLGIVPIENEKDKDVLTKELENLGLSYTQIDGYWGGYKNITQEQIDNEKDEDEKRKLIKERQGKKENSVVIYDVNKKELKSLVSQFGADLYSFGAKYNESIKIKWWVYKKNSDTSEYEFKDHMYNASSLMNKFSTYFFMKSLGYTISFKAISHFDIDKIREFCKYDKNFEKEFIRKKVDIVGNGVVGMCKSYQIQSLRREMKEKLFKKYEDLDIK